MLPPATLDTAWPAPPDFAFDHPEPARSLYAYAPVLYVRDRCGEWVVKRTGLVGSSGDAIARWTNALRADGVGVVSPAARFAPNPRRSAGGGEWVVYPYVRGRPYRASREQLRAAGTLLGRIHRHGRHDATSLRIMPATPRRDMAWLAARLDTIRHLLHTYIGASEIIDRCAGRCVSTLPLLPLAGGSADFKATNIVFAATATLIDPDHAALMPRLYDLATAVLLFHNDCPTAPRRLWTNEEWHWFRDAYLDLVRLSPDEIASWSDVLTLAWQDQAIWLLANFPEGWEDVAERAYLIDLAGFDPAGYPLGNVQLPSNS